MGSLLTTGSLFLRLVLLVLELIRERKDEGVGYQQAMNDVAQWVHRRVTEADAERLAAKESHGADDTDDAFDPDFRRD